ncbi:MAG: LptF/LptG family permease [Candidatus Loosdrechtia sp.]|uniref:LptF/LptG family permease n=1 Tax=Candidatus Loosdrechtia sp. TaxID=3101272 RepID=UPI003A6627B6|nr:MAG: LptF/LptG family permease [Candidatus Jettenia sp. AMX2]
MPYFFRHKTLQWYIVKEWFRTFVPSLVCFELMIFLGLTLQLLHKGIDIIALRELVLHLFIQALPYSIPSALLAATTISYGRMSADSEILAIQTSGIKINTITMPVLFIGIVFSAITLALCSEILPRSIYRVKLLQERAINTVLASRLTSFQKKFSLHPYQIYIGNVENGMNKDIVIIEYVEDYVTNVILAEEGYITMDEPEGKMFFTLHRGEFIQPDYRKFEGTPRLGAFRETVFEISLSEKGRDFSEKYLTIPQLYKEAIGLKNMIKNKRNSFNPKKDRDALTKELAACREEFNNVSKRYRMLLMELKQANETLTLQKSKIDGFQNEIQLAKNYILVSTQNLIQLKRQKIISPSLSEDRDKKVKQIQETLEKERQRIHDLNQKITTAEKIKNEEAGRIASLSQSISGIEVHRNDLQKEITALEYGLNIKNKENSLRNYVISIHRRLSQGVSAFIFTLIGIPLGIRIRSKHIMVGFGISFMIILFLYYPLAITGITLSKDTLLPVIPAIWGANIIFFVGGILVFRKLSTK